jgi:hypothetical protein
MPYFHLLLGLFLRLLLNLLVLLHIVKKVDDLFGGVLDDAHQVDLLVLAAADDLGDASTQFPVLLGCF